MGINRSSLTPKSMLICLYLTRDPRKTSQPRTAALRQKVTAHAAVIGIAMWAIIMPCSTRWRLRKTIILPRDKTGVTVGAMANPKAMEAVLTSHSRT